MSNISETFKIIKKGIKEKYLEELPPYNFLEQEYAGILLILDDLLKRETQTVFLNLKDSLENFLKKPTLVTTISYFYFRISIHLFQQIKKNPQIDKLPSLAETGPLVKLMVDPRNDEKLFPIILETAKISGSVLPFMCFLAIDEIKADPSNKMAPKIWSATVHKAEMLDLGFQQFSQINKKFPQENREIICDEIETAFLNIMKVGNNGLSNAPNLFEVVIKWDTVNNHRALLTLVLLMPNAVKDGKFRLIVGLLNKNLSDSKKMEGEVTQVTPVLSALVATKKENSVAKAVYKQIYKSLNGAVIKCLKCVDNEYMYNYLKTLVYFKDHKGLKAVLEAILNDFQVDFQESVEKIVLEELSSGRKEINIGMQYLVEKGSQKIFNLFSKQPEYFKKWMLQSEDTGKIIATKILETNSMDLLIALNTFYQEIDISYKDDSTLLLVKALHQVIKKRLFVEIDKTAELIPSLILSLCQFLVKVLKKGKEVAKVDKILATIDPTIYLLFTIPSQKIFEMDIKIITTISEICKLSKLDIKINPCYKEILEQYDEKNSYKLENPIFQNAFSKISITPQLTTMLIYMINTMQQFTSIVCTGENNKTSLTDEELLQQWINCMVFVLFFRPPKIGDFLKTIISCFEYDTEEARAIVITFARVCKSDIMDNMIEIFIADAKSLSNNKDKMTEFINFITCITVYKNNNNSISTEVIASLLNILYQMNRDKEIDIRLREILNGFILLLDDTEISKIDSNTKNAYIDLVSKWISYDIISYRMKITKSITMDNANILYKLTLNFTVDTKVFKNCINALILLLRNNKFYSEIVQKILINMLKENASQMIEICFGLIYSEDKNVRNVFFNVFKETKNLPSVAKKNIGWPKTAIDLVLDPNFVDKISSKIYSTKADNLSVEIIHAASVKDVEKEVISKMIDLELKDVNQNNVNMILRGNCLHTRVIGNFAKIMGNDWVNSMFVSTVKDLNTRIEAGENYEINPRKGDINPENMEKLLEELLDNIIRGFDCPPSQITFLVKTLHQKIQEKIGDEAFSIVFGFIFLRVILTVISVPANLDIDCKLLPKTKTTLLDASVILMAAINNGNLNEKKDFYHVFNDFSAKARQRCIDGMNGLLGRIDDIIIRPSTVKIDFSDVVVENAIVKDISESFDEIHDFFPTQTDYRRAVNYIKEYTFSHYCCTAKLNQEMLNCDVEGLSEILSENIPCTAKHLVSDSFIRVNEKLLVFNRSKLPAWPLMDALVYHILSVLSNQLTEFSIIFDATPPTNEENTAFDCKYIKLCINALSPTITDNLKEFILINANEDLIANLEETSIKKKVISAEKCIDFEKKYGAGLPYIDHSFYEPLAKTTAYYNGDSVTALLAKKYLCIQSNFNQKLCSKIIYYSTVDKIESCIIENKPSLYIVTGKNNFSVCELNQDFIDKFSQCAWKANRYCRIIFDPLNLQLAMNVGKIINEGYAEQILEKEKIPLFRGIIILSNNMPPNLAYEVLESVDKIHNLKSIEENNELFSYIEKEKKNLLN